jgi:hypothetical protein
MFITHRSAGRVVAAGTAYEMLEGDARRRRGKIVLGSAQFSSTAGVAARDAAICLVQAHTLSKTTCNM